MSKFPPDHPFYKVVSRWTKELLDNAEDPPVIESIITRKDGLGSMPPSQLLGIITKLIPVLHELRSTMMFADVPHQMEWNFNCDKKTEKQIEKWVNILFSEECTNPKELEEVLQKHNWYDKSDDRRIAMGIIMMFLNYIGKGSKLIKLGNAGLK